MSVEANSRGFDASNSLTWLQKQGNHLAVVPNSYKELIAEESTTQAQPLSLVVNIAGRRSDNVIVTRQIVSEESPEQKADLPQRLEIAEKRTLIYVARGFRDIEIATRLDEETTEHDVNRYRRRIYQRYAVNNGHHAVAEGIARKELDINALGTTFDLSLFNKVTPRERMLLQELINTTHDGRNQDISAQLGITEATVDKAFRRIYAKCNLRTRAHATAMYLVGKEKGIF